MKIAVIKGCKLNGNTDTLANQFIKGAKEAGHEVSVLNLFSIKMNGCIDCGTCRKNNHMCVWKDEIANYLPTYLEADVIVMASAIYWYGISGQLKTFIDRTFAIEDDIKDKKVYFISSCAAPEDEKFQKRLNYAIDSIEGYVACLRNNVAFEKTFMAHGMFQETDISKHPEYEQCYLEGKNL